MAVFAVTMLPIRQVGKLLFSGQINEEIPIYETEVKIAVKFMPVQERGLSEPSNTVFSYALADGYLLSLPPAPYLETVVPLPIWRNDGCVTSCAALSLNVAALSINSSLQNLYQL